MIVKRRRGKTYARFIRIKVIIFPRYRYCNGKMLVSFEKRKPLLTSYMISELMLVSALVDIIQIKYPTNIKMVAYDSFTLYVPASE